MLNSFHGLFHLVHKNTPWVCIIIILKLQVRTFKAQREGKSWAQSPQLSVTEPRWKPAAWHGSQGPPSLPPETHRFSLDHTASSKHSKDLRRLFRITGRHIWAKDTKRAQRWVSEWASSLAYIAKIRAPKHAGRPTWLLHFHLGLRAVKLGAPMIEVKVNCTLRSPQTRCRTTCTTQGWSFPKASHHPLVRISHPSL